MLETPHYLKIHGPSPRLLLACMATTHQGGRGEAGGCKVMNHPVEQGDDGGKVRDGVRENSRYRVSLVCCAFVCVFVCVSMVCLVVIGIWVLGWSVATPSTTTTTTALTPTPTTTTHSAPLISTSAVFLPTRAGSLSGRGWEQGSQWSAFYNRRHHPAGVMQVFPAE